MRLEEIIVVVGLGLATSAQSATAVSGIRAHSATDRELGGTRQSAQLVHNAGVRTCLGVADVTLGKRRVLGHDYEGYWRAAGKVRLARSQLAPGSSVDGATKTAALAAKRSRSSRVLGAVPNFVVGANREKLTRPRALGLCVRSSVAIKRLAEGANMSAAAGWQWRHSRGSRKARSAASVSSGRSSAR